MARPAPAAVNTVALLGTGTIGASWATYFLARGFSVTAWDPVEDNEERLRAFIEAAWPAMERLGLANGADPGRVRVVADPEAAVDGAVFVQENAPEDTALKRALYRRIDGALSPGRGARVEYVGPVDQRASGGLAQRRALVVGHPFNPPHLVPLVEVVAGATPTQPQSTGCSPSTTPTAARDPGRARGAGPHRQPAAGGAPARGV